MRWQRHCARSFGAAARAARAVGAFAVLLAMQRVCVMVTAVVETVVEDRQQLQLALQRKSRHVLIKQHMDLIQSDLSRNNFGRVSSATSSIRVRILLPCTCVATVLSLYSMQNLA